MGGEGFPRDKAWAKSFGPWCKACFHCSVVCSLTLCAAFLGGFASPQQCDWFWEELPPDITSLFVLWQRRGLGYTVAQADHKTE